MPLKIPKHLEWTPYANRDKTLYFERMKGRVGPCGHSRPCGCKTVATCCFDCSLPKCIFDHEERTPKSTKFGKF